MKLREHKIAAGLVLIGAGLGGVYAYEKYVNKSKSLNPVNSTSSSVGNPLGDGSVSYPTVLFAPSSSLSQQGMTDQNSYDAAITVKHPTGAGSGVPYPIPHGYGKAGANSANIAAAIVSVA